MSENDPTAIDPDEVIEDQTPPPEFEPQPDLEEGQSPGVVERPGEQVEDVEAEVDDEDLNPANGDADDDGDDGEEPVDDSEDDDSD